MPHANAKQEGLQEGKFPNLNHGCCTVTLHVLLWQATCLDASSRQCHVLFDLQTLHMSSLHLQRQAMFVQRILSHFQADHETSVSIS